MRPTTYGEVVPAIRPLSPKLGNLYLTEAGLHLNRDVVRYFSMATS